MQSDQRERIVEYIIDIDQQLEVAGQTSANRAFNLGCWFGLIPAGLLVLLIFFLSEGSWVVALVSAVMILISLIALANLAAFLAKSRSISRMYDERIKAQIEDKIVEFDLTLHEFNQIIETTLPQGSVLRKLAAHEEKENNTLQE